MRFHIDQFSKSAVVTKGLMRSEKRKFLSTISVYKDDPGSEIDAQVFIIA
jgi:hypothetical protein